MLFSTEKLEKAKKVRLIFLFNLLEEFFNYKKQNQLNKQDIKFTVIGSRKNFSKKTCKNFIKLRNKYKK